MFDRCRRTPSRSLLLRTFASRAAWSWSDSGASEEIASLNRRLQAIAADRARSLLAINNAVVLNLTQRRAVSRHHHRASSGDSVDRMTIFLYDEQKNVPAHGCRREHGALGPLRAWIRVGRWTKVTLACRSEVSGRSSVPISPRTRTYPGEEVLYREGSDRSSSCRWSCAARASAR